MQLLLGTRINTHTHTHTYIYTYTHTQVYVCLRHSTGVGEVETVYLITARLDDAKRL